jgi:MFS family permease
VTRSPSAAIRRLLAAHLLSAAATTLPVPLLVRAVYQATESTGALSLLGIVRLLPYVVLGSMAGRLVDRSDRRILLIVSAATRAALAAGIAVLALLHGPVGLMVALAVGSGIAATPAYAAAGAAVGALVTGAERRRAMSALTSVETGAWVAGPALGGLLLDCDQQWAAPAVSVLAATAAARLLVPLRLPPVPTEPSTGSATSVWQVLAFAPAVVTAVVLVNISIDGTGAVLVLLTGGGHSYGLLVAVLGSGAALSLAGTRLNRIRHLPLYLSATALALTAAGLLAWLPGRAGLLLIAGTAAVALEAAATTALQQHVPAHRHGEVLGALDQLLVGGALIGTAAAPLAATFLGPAYTVASAGLLLIPVATLLTGRHRSTRASAETADRPTVGPVERVPALATRI